MLEGIVSSRIRRTLLEYILTHSSDRFYLRGLAKTLDLSISPLRRELKRLQNSGLLNSAPEANILFYTVNTGSVLFRQLQQAVAQPAVLSSETRQASDLQPSVEVAHPVKTAVSSPVNLNQTVSPADLVSWQQVIKGPIGLATAAVGIMLMFILSGLFYLAINNQDVPSDVAKGYKLNERETVITVVTPPTSSSSGVMQGNRWKIVPGGFGGFSPAAPTEAL